jgi:ribosomal protein RSM22 (predicted rRNA methylase)
MFIPGTLLLYNSENPEVVENGIAAMNEFVKRLSQAAMLELIPTLKKAVTDLQRNAKNKNTVPGLTDPKVGLKVDKHTVNSRFSYTPKSNWRESVTKSSL